MNRKIYKTDNPQTDKEIEELAKKYSTPQTRDYIRQLFTTVVKLHLDGADERDLFLLNTTVKELRHIFRTFAKYRDKKKVVIFGSHRTPVKSKEYKLAEDFARGIIKRGFMVITGGGGGAMEAGNKGAKDQGFAVKIKLPLEVQPNQYISKGEKLLNVNYFFTRKLAFIKESEATVLFPGGFGTHDEGFEILTLLQTGKAAPRPIVLVETPGKTYWQSWLALVKKELLKGGYVKESDLDLFEIVHSADAAVAAVADFYKNYHSIRYARDITIIRLNKQIKESSLRKLSQKYRDIIKGEIRPSGPLPVEVRNKEFLHLPRICFKFDRLNYSRLVALVKDLNKI